MLNHKHRIVAWLFIVYGFAFTTPLNASTLESQIPDIGDAGSTVLTPRQEKVLGQEFMRSIRQNLNLLNDPLSTAYLQSLADKLQATTTENYQDIRVFIVDDPSINAFAGPGGYIGINTGGYKSFG